MFEQDRFIVRLQQSVAREADIVACFLAGSYGRRTEDAYSDLDVVLVFADEGARDQAWADRHAFARSVLPYVPARSYDAGAAGEHLHSALYGNGARVDYRYVAQDTLRPEPAYREIRILKDTAGWAEAYQADAARVRPTRERVEAATLEQIDNRFWVTFFEVYRQLLRGDADRPFVVYVRLLAGTIPPLLEALPPEDPAYQGLLHAYYDSGDVAGTIAHLQRFLDAYLAARSAVIRRHTVGFVPDSTFERGIQRLLERRG
jgi:hypothetical protein